MASIINPVLQLTTVDTNTTVRVTYTARFSRLDRHLAANGMRWLERIVIEGVDGERATAMQNFPQNTVIVSDGTSTLDVPRDRSFTVARSALQEDPEAGNDDEIRCQIQLVPFGLPVEVQAPTEIKTLLG